MSPKTLRLGTRASQLARWQAEFVAQQLAALGQPTEIVCLQTAGDASRRPLTELGMVGAFTKNIQQALLARHIDLAVHSLKDLPILGSDPNADPGGLRLAAILPRHSPHDVLVAQQGWTIEQLPPHSAVGTGSPRRRAQLLRLRPDLQVVDLRGNVDTRLKQVTSGNLQAIVLAEAGLERLGWRQQISQRFTLQQMLPAPGQGALAIEVRLGDTPAVSAAEKLHHDATATAVQAERSLLAALRGGCLAPVGAHAEVIESRLQLTAAVFARDGTPYLWTTETAEPPAASQLAQRVADQLLAQGARHLITASRRPPA